MQSNIVNMYTWKATKIYVWKNSQSYDVMIISCDGKMTQIIYICIWDRTLKMSKIPIWFESSTMGIDSVERTK